MSDFGTVQGLTLPGLVSALLFLGGGTGSSDAHAAGMQASISSRVLVGTMVAQAEQEDVEPTADAVPAENAAGDEVPFSELNEALTAARSRLAELTKAAEIAKVAGEIREELQAAEAENRQLKSVLSQLQTENSDIHSAKQAADRQIKDLEAAASQASAEAQRLDEELVAMRWQNSQLSTSLARTETVARETSDELTKVRDELTARAESLAAAADESAGEITRLQRELDEARERFLIAERRQAEDAAELVELKKTTEEATSDSGKLAQDLDATITELAKARSDLTSVQEALENAKIAQKTSEDEADVLRAQLTSNRTEADDLRNRLEVAETELGNVRSLNIGLEKQVTTLRAAAGEATDAARQNLLAVEDQINEINAALATVKADDVVPASDDQDDQGEPAAAPLANDDDGDAWVPRPSPPRAEVQRQLIAATASDTVQISAAPGPLAGNGTQLPANGEPDEQNPTVNLASLTTDLPEDQRQDAELLLDQLNAERDVRGVTMTVPGELLFAVNSERIEPAAFDALANVARLVDLYDERDVLIVGHTDAVGDANYNQQLSERRAALVRQFFIDNFQINEARLQIEGKGEQEPINSNATADGRNANRRVEVVILN